MKHTLIGSRAKAFSTFDRRGGLVALLSYLLLFLQFACTNRITRSNDLPKESALTALYAKNTTHYFSTHFWSKGGASADLPMSIAIVDSRYVRERKFNFYGNGYFFEFFAKGRYKADVYTNAQFNDTFVWLHPPRAGWFGFLQFCPFPYMVKNPNVPLDSVYHYYRNPLFLYSGNNRKLESIFYKDDIKHRYWVDYKMPYYDRKWRWTKIRCKFQIINTLIDTTIDGRTYNKVFKINANGTLQSKRSKRINGTKSTSFFLFSESRGFEYMSFSMADSMYCTIALDSVAARTPKK